MRTWLFAGGLALLSTAGLAQNLPSGSTIWHLDSLTGIGGVRPLVLGQPAIIESPQGKAIQFDGADDAVILDLNALSGAESFTLEVVFRPDPDGKPEQRFVHVQEVDDHRILVETRLTPDGRWFLDTFLKSGASERTLYAKDFPHPTGEWYHAALTYRNGTMRHFVNGVPEMEGTVDFRPMAGGQTSIGVRLNRVFWYKGAVRAVGFTPKALPPDEFILLKTVSAAP